MITDTLTRRGFLKIGAAFVGSAMLSKCAEPLLTIPRSHPGWIEERGDFCIVRVPDNKTLAKESFDMPVLFIMGQNSTVWDVQVRGLRQSGGLRLQVREQPDRGRPHGDP